MVVENSVLVFYLNIILFYLFQISCCNRTSCCELPSDKNRLLCLIVNEKDIVKK